MKVLVIGSGGREHAVIDSLAQSSTITKIFAAPGNGGMDELAELVPISADDIGELSNFALNRHMDLTFVGPEIPLSKGIVDLFQKRGLPVVEPSADQARIESSKSFAKQFFRTNNIPTANFTECSTPAEAYRVIASSKWPLVIKANGLAAGKGVVIAENADQARNAVHEFMQAKSLGEA